MMSVGKGIRMRDTVARRDDDNNARARAASVGVAGVAWRVALIPLLASKFAFTA